MALSLFNNMMKQLDKQNPTCSCYVQIKIEECEASKWETWKEHAAGRKDIDSQRTGFYMSQKQSDSMSGDS